MKPEKTEVIFGIIVLKNLSKHTSTGKFGDLEGLRKLVYFLRDKNILITPVEKR